MSVVGALAGVLRNDYFPGSERTQKATGLGLKVGVIEGDVDLTHPDLAGRITVALSCSFIYSTTPLLIHRGRRR